MNKIIDFQDLDSKTNLLPKDTREEYYRLENELFHSEFSLEKKVFSTFANGDIEQFNKLLKNQGFTIGYTTDDVNKTKQYAFITFFALAIRVCIENGLPEVEAYGISDRIVYNIDKMNYDEVDNLLIMLMSRMKEVKRGYSNNRLVNDAINYIYEHLHNDISRDEIAKAVGLNSTYLSTLFKKEKGISLSNYIVKAKIDEAKTLIKHKNLSSAEITYTLQFASESYFCTAFKKWVGKTPKEYRLAVKEIYS